MKRADRLQPVQVIFDDTEQRLARHLVSCERLLQDCELKLKELCGYRDDYTQGFARRAGSGMGAREMVDYQAFMVRLNEAIEHQQQVTDQARQERDLQQKRWQEAARRAKALGHVISTWQSQEQQAQARSEQRESDERAQRRRSPGPTSGMS